jgi:hypothetical protein
MSLLGSSAGHSLLEVAVVRESHNVIETSELLIKNCLEEIELELCLAALTDEHPKLKEDVMEKVGRQPVLESLAEILPCRIHLFLKGQFQSGKVTQD